MIMRNSRPALIVLYFIGLTRSREWNLNDPKCRLLNGYTGECRYLEKCKPLFDLNEKLQKTELEILFLQQSSCGTSSSYRYRVCCPPQSEWSKALQVDPVLFPELVNYMSDRGPIWGSNNPIPKPTEIDRGSLHNSQFSNTYGFNNDHSQRVGQTTFGHNAPNTNGQGFNNNYWHNFKQTSTIGQTTWNTNSQVPNNDHTKINFAQTTFTGQSSWNVNNYGFNNFQPQRFGETPINCQTTWNANAQGLNNDHTTKVTQTTFNGQTTWNANNHRLNNVQPQNFGGSPTIGQTTWNGNTQGPNNNPINRVTQTTFNGQTTLNANKHVLDNFQPQGVGENPTISQTNSNNQESNNHNTHKIGQTTFLDLTTILNAKDQTFYNFQTQKDTQTSSDSQISLDGSMNNPSQQVGETVFDRQTTTSTNAPGFDNDHSQGNYETPSIEQTTTNAYNYQTQKVGQTSSDSQISLDGSINNPSQKVGETVFDRHTTTSTNAPGFDNDHSQRNNDMPSIEQTTTIANTNGFQNDQRIEDSLSNNPTTLNTNPDESDKSQNNGETPSNDPMLLITIGHGLNNEEIIGHSPFNDLLALNADSDILELTQKGTSTTIATQESDVTGATKKNLDRCGVQSAVFNSTLAGGDAAPEQYPWLALLEYAGGVVSCGGSLISRRHVLTAAHCIDTIRGMPTAVRLSEYNITTYPVDVVTKNDSESQVNITVVPIEWSRMHPLFSHSSYQHDIGLVKMTQEVAYTDFIRPICLPHANYAKDFDEDTSLLVAGWGTDRWDSAEVKMDNRVPYVPIDVCHRLVRRAVGNKHLCAGERPMRKHCLGDYGGPLMFENEEFYVAVGVVSYGPQQCGDGSTPDVYTNVHEYMDWIKDNIADSNNDDTSTSTAKSTDT